MTSKFDIVILGAGPAGLSAARVAADHGAVTLVIDEQPEPGGQIYRRIEAATLDPTRLEILGNDYAGGIEILRNFRKSNAKIWSRASIINVTSDREIWVARNGGIEKIQTNLLLIATGALERPVPVPGWTLPGVMTAGALQILLKANGIVSHGKLVLAGSGPLLLQLAAQCLTAKIHIDAFIDTTRLTHLLSAIRHLPRALTGFGIDYLRKGLALRASLKKSNTRIFNNCRDIAIEGQDRVEAVTFRLRGKRYRIAAHTVALHEGVIPAQQMTRLMDCEHVWNRQQSCFSVRTDGWGNSSVPFVQVAGDVAGIGGAKAAESAGRIAAYECLQKLARIDRSQRDRLAADDIRKFRAHLAIRPFLDSLYRPSSDFFEPANTTLVCRCEEVAAGTIRDAIDKGCVSPDQVKNFTRCGMGPCQGRLCGPTVVNMIAAERGCSAENVGYYRIRPPAKPLSLAELAALSTDEAFPWS